MAGFWYIAQDMTEPSSKYAVLLNSLEDFKPVAIAKAIASLRNKPLQDVVGAVRGSWGIIESGLAEGAAKELSAGLTEWGFPASYVLEENIAELPESAAIKSIGIDDNGCSWTAGGEIQGAAWSEVVLVAASAYQDSQSKKVPVEAADAKDSAKTAVVNELVITADIILKNPPRRIRINADNFAYKCLGSAKTMNSLINFKAVLALIAKHAVKAQKNRGAEIFLKNQPVRDMGYVRPQDIERELRWLLTAR